MNKNNRQGGVWPIIGLGAGVAAGWMLRKFLQHKYEETHPLSKPESEKELLSEVFGEYSREAKNAYQSVSDQITSGMNKMKMSLEEIDVTKYRDLVNDAIDEVSKDSNLPKAQMDKLRTYLMADFESVKRGVKEEVKPAKRAVRRARKTS